MNFKYENGRRYHAFREGEYHLPNDESEQDRLDLQHAIFRYANDDKLFMAPLDRTKIYDVLDVGCGTGKWAMDVADELPQASVLGFDLRLVFRQRTYQLTRADMRTVRSNQICKHQSGTSHGHH